MNTGSSKSVMKLSNNGTILGTFAVNGANWIAFDGANIWVTNNFGYNTVSKM